MTERERLVEEMARAAVSKGWEVQGREMPPFEEFPEQEMQWTLEIMEAALSAVLKRHRVVPVEPTEGMVAAGMDALAGWQDSDDYDERNLVRSIYARMIACRLPNPANRGGVR